MNKNIILISAVAPDKEGRLVIGKDEKMPWNIPEDLRHFYNKTFNCPVIMGRKTFQSIGKVLPHRLNVVISRDSGLDISRYPSRFEIFPDISHTLDFIKNNSFLNNYIIGGESIYREFMPHANFIELTRIHEYYEGDRFFPDINLDEWKLFSSEKHSEFDFELYVRK
jgi:dihydrofolate reductase